MCRCLTASDPASTPSGSRSWSRALPLGFLAALILLAAAASQRAADPPLAAGLKPGDDLPGPFRPWAFTGKHLQTLRTRILATIREKDDDVLKEAKKKQADDLKGMFHCPLSEHGLNPVVLVFVKGTDPSPALLQLLQKLDEAVPKHERERLAVVVVFLDPAIEDVVKEDDPRSAAAAVLEPKLNQLTAITAALDGFKPVKELYKLNPDADVTVILYEKLKVLSARALLAADLDEKTIGDLVKEIEEKLAALGGVPVKPMPPK